MTSPYKRRRPTLIRNLWVYRRLVALAMVLGLMLWFIWTNSDVVKVSFPFGLGTLSCSTGILILASALVGAVVSALIMTMIFVVRRRHQTGTGVEHAPAPLPDDRPPPDYASKTTEGFPDSNWTA